MTKTALRHLEGFVREIAREIVHEALQSARTDRVAATAPRPSSRSDADLRSAWLSTREAAAYVRRKPDTIRRWAKAGLVEARKVGGSAGLEFHRPSLDAYLASRGVSADSSD